MNPEDLFRAFFGGGASPFGGSPFGGGGGPFQFHSFNMGGGGHPFFQAQHTRRRHQHQQQQQHNQQQHQRGPASDFDGLRNLVRQLLPIILFFFFSIVSSWMSSSNSTTSFSTFDEIADLVSLQPGLGFPYHRASNNLKVDYYATTQFQSHFKELDEAKTRNKRPPHRLQRELNQYEETLEKHYVKDLQRRCKAETNELNQRIKAASRDSEELKRLRNQKKPSCDKLHSLGIK